ncbi:MULTISPECIES: hypothetical protein [Sorangium]|uniref:MlpA protein n=1 Tax=Sorangium cellulosum TaxID=56 RepID=A0A4P2QIE2_SORCE|nr:MULTISPECIES: hypothetical protein [Sorangium]AUX29690.1 MlpA protein [Sorangium cellulosum]WCQ89079.1 hypothetical protein NQZ70_01765 [Sorangium sp. Soce836]
MKRTLGTSLGILAIAALSLSCEQRRVTCTAAHGGFAAKYTLKPGSKQGEGACDTLKGEIVGIEKYNPRQPGNPKRPDFTKAHVAVRASGIAFPAFAAQGAQVELGEAALDSIGDFAAVDPDEDDVCTVPSLSEARLSIPAYEEPPPPDAPEDTPPTQRPAVEIGYAWSNLRIYVTAAYPGTQIVGDLTYTEDGCSASYSVVGLYPAVECAPDGVPDPTLCDPRPDLAKGRAFGSGINPDFADRVACDAETGLCVLTSLPDALQ